MSSAVTEVQNLNFNEACTRVREGDIPTQSIGVLKEKPLHAILKWWLDDNPAHHEIRRHHRH